MTASIRMTTIVGLASLAGSPLAWAGSYAQGVAPTCQHPSGADSEVRSGIDLCEEPAQVLSCPEVGYPGGASWLSDLSGTLFDYHLQCNIFVYDPVFDREILRRSGTRTCDNTSVDYGYPIEIYFQHEWEYDVYGEYRLGGEVFCYRQLECPYRFPAYVYVVDGDLGSNRDMCAVPCNSDSDCGSDNDDYCSFGTGYYEIPYGLPPWMFGHCRERD